MKITKDNLIEKYITNLYKLSISIDGDEMIEKIIEAQHLVGQFMKAFEILEVYDGKNHVETFTKLYLSKNNVFTLGKKKMAKAVYMSIRGLLEYRRKYCRIVVKILNDNNIDVDSVIYGIT